MVSTKVWTGFPGLCRPQSVERMNAAVRCEDAEACHCVVGVSLCSVVRLTKEFANAVRRHFPAQGYVQQSYPTDIAVGGKRKQAGRRLEHAAHCHIAEMLAMMRGEDMQGPHLAPLGSAWLRIRLSPKVSSHPS